MTDKLKITYSRSSGPGGQHVNKGCSMGIYSVNMHRIICIKDFVHDNFICPLFCLHYPVNTKAEVRFHVQTAEWIPEEVRKEILVKVQKETVALCCLHRSSKIVKCLIPKLVHCDPIVFLTKTFLWCLLHIAQVCASQYKHFDL